MQLPKALPRYFLRRELWNALGCILSKPASSLLTPHTQQWAFASCTQNTGPTLGLFSPPYLVSWVDKTLTLISLDPSQQGTTPTSRPTESSRETHPQLFPYMLPYGQESQSTAGHNSFLSFSHKYTLIFYSKMGNWTKRTTSPSETSQYHWLEQLFTESEAPGNYGDPPLIPLKVNILPLHQSLGFYCRVVVDCPQVSTPAQLEPTAEQKLQLLKCQPLAQDWREIGSFIPVSPYPVERPPWQ